MAGDPVRAGGPHGGPRQHGEMGRPQPATATEPAAPALCPWDGKDTRLPRRLAGGVLGTSPTGRLRRQGRAYGVSTTGRMTRFHGGGSDPGHAPDQNKNEADRS